MTTMEKKIRHIMWALTQGKNESARYFFGVSKERIRQMQTKPIKLREKHLAVAKEKLDEIYEILIDLENEMSTKFF